MVVRADSTAFESLTELNRRFRGAGRPEVKIRRADPWVETGRLLEMVHAGRIGEVIDWRVDGDISVSDAEAALGVLDQLMVPADPNQVLTELGKTRAVLATRKETEENQSIVLAVYVEMIDEEGYPIDVVLETCRDLRKLTKFWPTWSEFKERADREFLKRRALYKALCRIVSGIPNG